MPSVTYKVSPDDELIDELQRMPEIQQLNLQLAG
jgi:hypothetical protein